MKAKSIILPAYNEEKTLPLVVDDIKEHCKDTEIIVVDNNSTDNTYDIATNLNVDKVFREVKQGKGYAVRKGIANVSAPKVVIMDADYTYPAMYAEAAFDNLKYYDVIMGYRSWRQRGSMTRLNAFGNYLLSRAASLLYTHRVWDICTGLWGFRKEVLDIFGITSGGFSLEADFFSNAKWLDCRICQIPIDYRKRPDGSQAKLKIRDGFKILWFLLKARF